MQGQKEKLERKIQEQKVKKRLEGEVREDRGVVERFAGLLVREREGGGNLWGEWEREYDEQLAEGRAGKVKIEVEEFEVGITQIENENEEDESSEQIDSPANELDSRYTKRKKQRSKRSKGSKGKNKVESQEDVKSTVSPAAAKPSTKHTAAVEAAASLLGSMANDPLLKSVLSGTAKPPNSSLWRAFTQSPLYNTSGSAPALNAMLAFLHQPGQTPVLGAATSIWAGDEHLLPEGRRDPVTGDHRAAWPEMSEMKAEGQYRREAGKERRLPVPRHDLMTKEAIIREVGGMKKVDAMSREERDKFCREMEKRSGEEVVWMDREPVRFSDFDRLESVSKERREENTRRRKREAVYGPTPHGANGHGQGEQRRGPNMGLRGGFSQSGAGRRHTGPPAPVPPWPVMPKPVNFEAVCFGANGPGDGMKPLPGGWVFDEEFLKQKGDWEDLLDNHL
jgi:hypothetical protein